jgi:hypothetical protein
MRNTFIAIALILIGFISLGCQVVSGSGVLETKVYDVAEFTKIEVNQPFDITITHADEHSISITADDNIHQYLEVRVNDEEISIDLDHGRSYNHPSITLKAEIALPNLSILEVNGASEIGFAGVFSEDLLIHVNGASEIIGDLLVNNNLKLQLDGAVSIKLKGVAGGDLNLNLNGLADANLRNFRVDDADIELNGASRTQIWATDSIYGEVNGTSQLVYYGDPEIRVEKNGVADFKKGD